MSCEIHIGNIVQFQSTLSNCDGVAIDISTATTKKWLFQKPDGSLLTVDGDFLTDGTDGILVYRTTPFDLDQSGTWRYQIHVIFNSNEQYTDITKFKVFANLPLT